jgi:hypothetical protein
MNENTTISLNALRDFIVGDDAQAREQSAVLLINSVLNDLEGMGAYNVLSSALTGFTAAQPIPWQSLSYVIQGVMHGWDNVLRQAQVQAQSDIKGMTRQ